MAGIPTNFQSVSPVLASYDWLDITSGTGYRRYYAVGSGDNTLFLSSRSMTSSTDYWSYTANFNSTTPALTIDLDFDITLNVPADIKGTAYFNGLMRAWNNAGATSRFTVNVYHVNSGGTETLLGTAVGANTNDYYRECLKISLTQKHFAIGEKLRLNVILHGWNTGLSTGKVTVFYDPTSVVTKTDTSATTSDTRTVGTDMYIDVPFRVNL